MKIWLDSTLPMPKGEGYNWICRNVDDAKNIISRFELMKMTPDPLSTASEKTIDLIDIAIDLGDEIVNGGSSLSFIRWLELNKKYYPIRIHAKNIHEAVKVFNNQDWSPYINKIFIMKG